MMSSAFPSWEAFYSFITSVKQVLFLVVDDSFFSCFFPSLAAQALYTIPKSWQAKLLYNIFTFLYCVFWVYWFLKKKKKKRKCKTCICSVLSLQCWWEIWCHVPHKCPRERNRILPVHPSRWNVYLLLSVVMILSLSLPQRSQVFMIVLMFIGNFSCLCLIVTLVILTKWCKLRVKT